MFEMIETADFLACSLSMKSLLNPTFEVNS